MKLLAVAVAALVAVAAGEANAVAASIISPAPKHENNGGITYHCDHDVGIMACPANGAACATTELCRVRCIENQRGAECSPEIPVALAKKDEGALEAEAKKSYECSNDQTRVLVCKYGFCSTDHYCRKGTKCSDKCACCKRTKLFSREAGDIDNTVTQDDTHRIDAELNAPEESPQNLAPFDIHESCKPGYYPCAYSEETHSEWTVVCENTGVNWRWSADCGKGGKCISGGGVAFCIPKKKDLLEARGEPKDPALSIERRGCVSGSYRCSDPNILTCNAKGEWVQSAYCGRDAKCIERPPGIAHCVPRQMSHITRQDPKACATEGSYACNKHFVVRFENGEWEDVEDCGSNLICALNDKGVGYCIAPPPSKQDLIA